MSSIGMTNRALVYGDRFIAREKGTGCGGGGAGWH
jgi:hypothetical protein